MAKYRYRIEYSYNFPIVPVLLENERIIAVFQQQTGTTEYLYHYYIEIVERVVDDTVS